MTNEIDYREVLMHYSKPEIEGGMEYTDEKEEADDKVIEDYEAENKINLQNYFCDDCTDKTLRQIEGKE